MSKKSNLKILDDAVVRIQGVIENDDGQNPLFSETMAFYQYKWLKEFHIEATKSPTHGRKATTNPGSSDKKDMPVPQN